MLTLNFPSEYNDMKTELKDFLQRFAAEGKVGFLCVGFFFFFMCDLVECKLVVSSVYFLLLSFLV